MSKKNRLRRKAETEVEKMMKNEPIAASVGSLNQQDIRRLMTDLD